MCNTYNEGVSYAERDFILLIKNSMPAHINYICNDLNHHE